MIVLDDVSYSYSVSKGNAVQNIALELATGAHYCLLGADLSGKTTLCKLIAGELKPESGSIRYLDDQGSQEAVRPYYIGGDPYDCIVGVSMNDDMEFGLRNLGLEYEERRKRISETLDWLDMKEVGNRLIYTLSGGERQKAALATAIAMRSKLMILDESTDMLDPKNRKSIRLILDGMKKDFGITVIQVSSDPLDLLHGEKIVFLEGGSITFLGEIWEFLETSTGREWFEAVGGVWPIITGIIDQRDKWDKKMNSREAIEKLLHHNNS